VDLHTAHPLDYNRFVLITRAKANYNDLSNTVGPQLSGLISNTFDDGMFGALASISWSRRNYLDTGASTVRWDEAQVLKTGTTSRNLVTYYHNTGRQILAGVRYQY
jgi:iron complex outermembrane recepter protein